MKKLIPLIVLILFPFILLSQNKIQISEDYTTILVFPSEIEESILGNEQEYLVKPSNNSSSIGKRTLRLGYIKLDQVEKNTNLTVFTKDGYSYEFSLFYTKKPTVLNHYMQVDNSAQNLIKSNNPSSKDIDFITAENPSSYYSEGVQTIEAKSISSKDPANPNQLYDSNKMGYIKQNCAKVNDLPKLIFRTFEQSSNIKLTLKQISYDRDELYFHFSLENKGGQIFDVDFINSKLARGYKGVSTDQSIPLTPLFIFNKPERVPGNSEHNFIIVFEKFTINDKKELQIDLAEKEGERDLLLQINNKLINNPVKL
ncbi:uncharacterized protein DUF4138 [Mariniflexile fucanivorans]|uniref:Uncharacterized protein DUF4138 n=1 Tax=Mariniflexile fucanivorans TaxID=264023 RepID=A0A4R1R9V7_9FLAO|nr:DUF4138 domain-containing protein [Mariniflexile fucanivorans]TCL62476.1 uncharacterized protein DUF4138 [Mariniflexile fucanivorans]